MAVKVFEIDLDIKDPKFKLVSPIEVVSGDTDTNIFNIQLFENFVPVNASGNTVVIIFGKPDNTTVFQNLTVVDATKGQYTCTLSSQTIAVPGRIKAEVALYEGIKRLTSTRFEFNVRKPILDEETVESTNEFSALTEALGTVNQYDNRITELESEIENIEANKVKYDNTESNLQSDNVQEAIDEVVEDHNTHLADSAYYAKGQGLEGDGVTDDYTAFSDLLTAISSDEREIYFSSGTYVIGTNITIPENVKLIFAKGAKLSPSVGVTITINGSIEAGLYQIFTGSGLIFGDLKNKEVYPQWYGDNTSSSIKKAIQLATNNSTKSGIVRCKSVPEGYAITSQIIMPKGCTILGDDTWINTSLTDYSKATTFLVTYITDGAIKQAEYSVLKNISFYYPEQTKTNPPVVYPPTIQLAGSGTITKNIFLLNSYIGIQSVVGIGRNEIKNIYGNPLYRGIDIKESYDVVRIKNIHFWPYYYIADTDWRTSAIYQFVYANATGIYIERADEIELDDIFVYGYFRGICLRKNPSLGKSGYGQLNNIKLDYCRTGILFSENNVANGWNLNNIHIAVAGDAAANHIGINVFNCGTTPISITNFTVWSGINYKNYIHANSGRINLCNAALQDTSSGEMISLSLDAIVDMVNVFFGAVSETGYHIALGSDLANAVLLTSARYGSAKNFYNPGAKTITETAVI